MKTLRIILCSMIMAVVAFGQTVAPQKLEPAPGTREYFDKYIDGNYTYSDGRMNMIYQPSVVRGVIRAPSSVGQANAASIKGTIKYLSLTNNMALIAAEDKPLASGAIPAKYVAVQLESITNRSVGEDISTRAIIDGQYNCVLSSGVTNVITGYKEITTITFEQYLEVFKKDSQSQPLGEVISLERKAGVSQRLPYREMLRARREQNPTPTRVQGDELKQDLRQYNMDLIRAKGKKGVPLPIPLTPEQDAQLVEEGVLPPKK